MFPEGPIGGGAPGAESFGVGAGFRDIAGIIVGNFVIVPGDDPGAGGVRGLQLRIAPMVHKKVTTWADLPATLYAALPLYFEGRRGTYTTGSQFVLGSLWDLTDTSRTYVSTEVGIRLAKAESYLLVGFGLRIGELRFTKRGASGSSSNTANPSGQKDFTDADFR